MLLKLTDKGKQLYEATWEFLDGTDITKLAWLLRDVKRKEFITDNYRDLLKEKGLIEEE